jgi:2-dehydro-3-deoxygluconokinase
MGSSFISLGECMVELSDQGGGLYRRGFAGDTFNTAWYARRILPKTWSVSYGSCIGADAASGEMRAFMEAGGIDTKALRVIPDQTVGLYMISLDQGERSFSYWRSQSAARCLADDPAWLQATLAGCDVIYFSGITLAILSPEGRAALCAALAEARRQGTMIAFDTNLRPRLWEDHATMQTGIMAGAAVADIILPSFDEEQILFEGATASDTIARYRAAGAHIIALKDGAGDVQLWDEAGGVRVLPCRPVEHVVDSTAAGDSFGAAFVANVAQGCALEEAALAAMQLAGRVIQYRGALVPQIFKGEK